MILYFYNNILITTVILYQYDFKMQVIFTIQKNRKYIKL